MTTRAVRLGGILVLAMVMIGPCAMAVPADAGVTPVPTFDRDQVDIAAGPVPAPAQDALPAPLPAADAQARPVRDDDSADGFPYFKILFFAFFALFSAPFSPAAAAQG